MGMGYGMWVIWVIEKEKGFGVYGREGRMGREEKGGNEIK